MTLSYSFSFDLGETPVRSVCRRPSFNLRWQMRKLSFPVLGEICQRWYKVSWNLAFVLKRYAGLQQQILFFKIITYKKCKWSGPSGGYARPGAPASGLLVPRGPLSCQEPCLETPGEWSEAFGATQIRIQTLLRPDISALFSLRLGSLFVKWDCS